MGHTLDNVIWRKSSYSGSNGGACVDVADNLPGIVAVRDSKDPNGPALTFAPAGWRAFTSCVSAVNLVSTEPPTIRPRQGHFMRAVVVAETRWFFLLRCRA